MKTKSNSILAAIFLALFLVNLQVYGQQAQGDSADESYLQAREVFRQAKDLFLLQKFDEARPLLSEAIKIYPQYCDAYFYTAQILYKNGEFDKALQAIADAESHFNTVLRMELSATENEIQQNLIKQERRYLAADMYFVYGNISMRKKDYRKAHEKYLEAVQYNPRHRQAFNNIINLHLLLDNRELALELLKRAEASGVQVNPKLKLELLASNGELDKQETWKVTLKNGQVWVGRIVSREGSIIKVNTDLGELEFHKDGIFSIEPYTGEVEAPAMEQVVEIPRTEAQEFRPRRRIRFKKLFFQMDYNFFSHASSDYRDVYGSSASYTVMNVGYRFSSALFMKFGFNYFGQEGEVPEVGIRTEADHKLWSLVLGYEGKIVGGLAYQVEGGPFYINYKEKVRGAELGDNAVGFRLGGNLVYRFGDSAYTVISAGYLNASDTIANKQVKLGGLYTGAGIGLLF
jgi:tetratricopeptide (TPR) repeat protein